MLWILAGVAVALLSYEIPTLVTSVLMPLLGNPNALQTDFHYYYEAAQRFSADSHQLYRLSDDVIAGFAYPPPAIVPFVWLSRLPLGVAFLLTTIASYAAVIIAVELWWSYLRRHAITVDRGTRLAVLLVVLALGPTYMNAVFGQVNTLVLASAVGFVAAADARPLLAGSVVAVGAWLKIYPALLLWVWAWDRGAWRAIGWTAGAVLIIGVLSLPMVPVDAFRTFVFDVLPARGDKTAIHIANQSLAAFLERFRHEPSMFLDWTGQQAVTVGSGVRAINFAFLGIAMIALAVIGRRHKGVPHVTAALMALIAIVAPLGWGHTYVMALPLVVMALLALKDAETITAIVIAGCLAALMIPAGRHLPIDWAPEFAQNLVYSRYLLAAVVLTLLVLDSRTRRA